MVDHLDHELERRGRRFVRYANDFIIVVKSQRAAERVMHNISSFIREQRRGTMQRTFR